MSLVRIFMLTLISLACLGLVACTFPPRIYRFDIRQGNYITPEMLAKLKVGMSKEAVLNVMGTPALAHMFERDRWDYYYYLKPGNGEPIVERRATLYFKGNKVQRLEEMIDIR